MKEYQGHRSWNTWNVALWIANDEPLYRGHPHGQRSTMRPLPRQHCGHCHTCGFPLKSVLDGEEWCTICGQYRRYHSHGWGTDYASPDELPDACPSDDALQMRRFHQRMAWTLSQQATAHRIAHEEARP